MATASVENRLHSRYQPAREAARFLDHHPLPAHCTDIIVLGPGEGYLFPELAKRYPQAKLVGIQITGPHEDAPANRSAQALHQYRNPALLQNFLDKEICGNDSEKTSILTWPPALRVQAVQAKEVLETLRNWTERRTASSCTMKFFGERWLKNAFRSLALPHSRLSLDRPLGPIVLASAGPSLEKTIDTVLAKTPRNTWSLIAVSSAVPALLARGFTPDLIVASDGGNWAKWHLAACARVKVPLLYQLGAALPSTLQGAAIQVTATDQAWQKRLLQLRGLPPIQSPQRGSVSAVALDIALTLSDDMIYMAGLDLESATIRSHARPYAFDALALSSESRTLPLWHWFETRKALYKNSRAMDIYAQWYREQTPERRSRCRILSTSGKACFDMDGAKQIAASGTQGGTISMESESAPSPWPPNSRALAGALLEDPESRDELAELLDVPTDQAEGETVQTRLTRVIERAWGKR